MDKSPIKLKAQLIIAMICVVVVPIVVFYLSMDFNNKTINNMKEMDIIKNEGRELASKVAITIEENYQMMNDFDTFTAKIKANIARTNRIVIQDLNHKVLYDSEVKGIANLNIVDANYLFKNSINATFNYVRLGITIFRSKNTVNHMQILQSGENIEVSLPYSFSVIENGEKIAEGTLFLGYGPELSTIYRKVMKISNTFLLPTLLSLIFMVWLVSRIMDKKVLRPLSHLNKASLEMTEGNFDYPINYDKEDEMGMFCSQFQSMRKDLADSIQRLEHEANERRILIGNIAHDLRTPITSIRGYVEGFIDGVPKDEETEKRYYNVIKNKAEQLDYLIYDLFNFSQLELGQLKANCHPISSNQLIEKVVSGYEDIDIVLDDTIMQEDKVLAIDEKQIARVFCNIIDNAIKFGASNIKIKAIEQSHFLRVEIRDNGPGIPAELHKKIFDRFYCHIPQGANKVAGSGMGLAICQGIIEIHGGEIGVDSAVGKGSTFYFTLPLKVS